MLSRLQGTACKRATLEVEPSLFAEFCFLISISEGGPGGTYDEIRGKFKGVFGLFDLIVLFGSVFGLLLGI